MADEFLTEEERSIVSHAIDLGSDLSGSLVGAGLGLLLAGPPGALAGAAAAPLIKKTVGTLGDVIRRRFSNREGQRILTGANAAIFQIQYRIDAGQKPRNDDFFTDEENGSRSAAAELFEGSMLKCRDSYQEKKIRFIANIYATTAFDRSVSAEEANFFLNLTGSITYRQICFLAVFENRNEWNLLNRDNSVSHPDPIISDHAALEEIHSLYYSGLLYSWDGTADSWQALIGIEGIVPAEMYLTDLGQRFVKALDVRTIDENDLRKMAALLETNP